MYAGMRWRPRRYWAKRARQTRAQIRRMHVLLLVTPLLIEVK